ncbi:MAG: glycosyltransferase [Planctomycetota bacterium]
MKNILVLASPQPAADHINRDIGRALEGHGFRVTVDDLAAVSGEGTDQFNARADRVYRANPDFVLMCGIEGILRCPAVHPRRHLLDLLRVPYISVNFQSPVQSLYQAVDTAADAAIIAVSDGAYIDNLRSFGYEHVCCFPGATDPVRFAPGAGTVPEGFDPGAPLAFVGGLENAERLTWRRTNIASMIMPVIIQAVVTGRMPVNKAIHHSVERMVDRGDLTRADFSPVINAQLHRFCAAEADFLRRREIIRSLAPLEVNAAGAGWSDERAAHIHGLPAPDAGRELPAIYGRAPVTVGIASAEGVTGAPLEVFDCAACGGFSLFDHRDDLAHFFALGTEIDCYRTQRELAEKAAHYLAEPALRAEMAGRARARVLLEHTWERRVIKLIEAMDRFTGAAHAGMASRPVHAPAPPPTLSVVVVARNEEALLPVCLDSVAGLTDDVVVVDTGSIDATPDVARGRGARLFARRWEHDFAQVRNFGLECATGDWVLVLNADEECLVDPARPLREMLAAQPATVAALTVALTDPATDGVQHPVRLVRRASGARFGRPLEDTVEPPAGMTVAAAALVIRDRRTVTSPRGERLVREVLATGRGTLHMVCGLVRALARRGDWDEVQRFGALFPAGVEAAPLVTGGYRTALHDLCRAHLARGDDPAALATACSVLARDATDAVMWACAARAFARREHHDRAWLAAMRCKALAGAEAADLRAEADGVLAEVRAAGLVFPAVPPPPAGVTVTACFYCRGAVPPPEAAETLRAAGLDAVLLGNATGDHLPAAAAAMGTVMDLDPAAGRGAGWNALVDRAGTDWALMLEPQESIDPAALVLLKDLLALHAAGATAAFRVTCDTWEDGGVQERRTEVRLVRPGGGARFEGAAYADAAGAGGAPVLDVVIADRGADRDPAGDRRESELRAALLEGETGGIRQEHAVRVHIRTGNWPMAALAAQRGLAELTGPLGAEPSARRKFLTIALAEALLEMDAAAEADGMLAELMQANPEFTDAYYFAIRAAVELGATARLADLAAGFHARRRVVLRGPYREPAAHRSLFRHGDVLMIEAAMEILAGRPGGPRFRQGLDESGGRIAPFVQSFLEERVERVLDAAGVREALAAHPDTVDGLLLLFAFHRRKHNSEATLEVLQRLERISPFHRGDAAYYQAEIHLAAGDRARMIEYFQRGIAEYQNVLAMGVQIPAGMLLRYGECLERTGRITAAISMYEMLLQAVGPSDAVRIQQKIRELQELSRRDR